MAAITRDDLLAWHRTLRPSEQHDPGRRRRLRPARDGGAPAQGLRRLGAGAGGAEAWRSRSRTREPGVYFVEKDDVNQSNIRLVHLGITRDNPDYYAVEVMNEVFGGGFSAPLFTNVRTKKGLAYGSAAASARTSTTPACSVAPGPRARPPPAGIEALDGGGRQPAEDPATQEELQRAKEAILNSFVFRFDSKAKVLREKMLYEFYGYPLDFLERYRAAIEKVTADDVARVAQKYVHKDRWPCWWWASRPTSTSRSPPSAR